MGRLGVFLGRHGPLRAEKSENAKIFEKPIGNHKFLASGGALWGPLGALLGRLWGLMGPLGTILGRLGAILGRLGPPWGHLEALLESQEAQEAEFVDFPQVFVCLGPQNEGRQIGVGGVARLQGGVSRGDIKM